MAIEHHGFQDCQRPLQDRDVRGKLVHVACYLQIQSFRGSASCHESREKTVHVVQKGIRIKSSLVHGPVTSEYLKMINQPQHTPSKNGVAQVLQLAKATKVYCQYS